MKKFIYISLFSLLIASSFTSCTEENIQPKQEEGGGGAAGGGDSDPKKNG